MRYNRRTVRHDVFCAVRVEASPQFVMNVSDQFFPGRIITPWLLVRKRTIPTERPPLVGEVSANFCG
jgi:hypothetical protein